MSKRIELYMERDNTKNGDIMCAHSCPFLRSEYGECTLFNAQLNLVNSSYTNIYRPCDDCFSYTKWE